MPADIVMVRIDGVADPAFRLDAENQRIEKVLAGNRLYLRQRKNRGRHRTGRMNDRLQVGVVEIENMARHAIDEGGVHDIEPLAAAEQRGLRRAREGRERRDRDLHGLMTRSADRNADPVQQRPHAFLANIRRQVVIGGGHEIARKRARDLFRRSAICGSVANGFRRLGESRVGCRHSETAAAVCIKVRRSVTGILAASSSGTGPAATSGPPPISRLSASTRR